MEPVLLNALTTPSPERQEPLAVQLYRDLLAAIVAGRLPSGRLPSSRAAAGALGLSRNTVNTAYDLLRADGAVTISPGAAPKVVEALVPRAQAANRAADLGLSPRGQLWADSSRDRDHAAVMSPGQPDEGLFPRDEWARLLRRAARQSLGAAFGYPHYSGLPRLKTVLARRLAADRGMVLSPDQILITPGTQASLTLIALTLASPGDCALIEDPVYGGARAAFAGAGLTLAPLPVDREGADPTGAPRARLIYLTPANQYPLGHRLSVLRRRALIAHATRHNSVLIEDDYDSEFLWHGREIAALQGQAPERTITLGTLSKALMPGLRLGWIVAPPNLAGPLAAAQRALGLASNVHAQAALADLIDSGRYRAHLARIAARYGERGRTLAAAVRALSGVRADNPEGGVQLAIHLPEGAETACLAALHRAGFGTAALSSYALQAQVSGLVSGFADATPERIAKFTAVLRGALADPAGATETVP